MRASEARDAYLLAAVNTLRLNSTIRFFTVDVSFG